MAFDRLSERFISEHRQDGAVRTAAVWQKIWYGCIALALILLLFYRWDYFVFLVAGLLMLLYMAGALQKLLAAVAGWFGGVETVSDADLAALDEAGLPVYTVFLPLYKEGRIADKIVRRIDALDYPRDKLDVKLLIEADDDETRQAIEAIELPAYFEVVTAPAGLPRTKPRACNYGLEKARGELCVIYDAEDIPDRDQLRKAVTVFRRHPGRRVACVQAKLNYYNYRQNWLTRMFTIEYSTTFDLILPGLSVLGAPLPLGGTSNHFRTDILRELGGWDPFNVTEDCDLGLRIGHRKHLTLMLESTTMEEANSHAGNFIRQRSRWVKGFMQTHLVHARHPLELCRNLGLWGMLNAWLTVGGSVLMMLTNLICWPILLLYIFLLIAGLCNGIPLWDQLVGPADVETARVGWRAWHLVYLGEGENPWWSTLSLAFGIGSAWLLACNFLLVGVGALAVAKRRLWTLMWYVPFLPAYWVLISIGAWKGAWQLITKPFYWEKTRHGLDS